MGNGRLLLLGRELHLSQVEVGRRVAGDSDLLQWLDGNNQVDKVVNIASTAGKWGSANQAAYREGRSFRSSSSPTGTANLSDVFTPEP